MADRESLRLGKLPPQYTFVLNPHSETRVGRCPICEKKMHQRKVPLLIHVEPFHTVVLGYTCRYCPDCDLLVAHQDQIEALLAAMFERRAPEIIGNDYLVLGTVEYAYWRQRLKQPGSIGEILEQLHDFKEELTLEFRPAGWYPADDPELPSTRSQQPDTHELPAAAPTARPIKPKKRKRQGKKGRR
jgi:hypothetical protein